MTCSLPSSGSRSELLPLGHHQNLSFSDPVHFPQDSAAVELAGGDESRFASSYSVRLASWSQPNAATQAGFRIGHGAFLPFNYSKAIAEAIHESHLFIHRLLPQLPSPGSRPNSQTTVGTPSSPAAPQPKPIKLSRPFKIPQSRPRSPRSPFLRCSTEELNSPPDGIPIELFTDFIDILNGLILAGVSDDESEEDRVMISSDDESRNWEVISAVRIPSRPEVKVVKPIERFIEIVNELLFMPRGIHCEIKPSVVGREKRDKKQPKSARKQLVCKKVPDGGLAEEAEDTLPIRRTLLDHFPVRLDRSSTLMRIYQDHHHQTSAVPCRNPLIRHRSHNSLASLLSSSCYSIVFENSRTS